MVNGYGSRRILKNRAPYVVVVGKAGQSKRLCTLRHKAPRLAIPALRPGCYAYRAIRCSRIEKEDSMRARNQDGSVVLDKRIKTWNFLWWENGKRRSKKIGTVRQYPTKASAWRVAKTLQRSLDNQETVSTSSPTVNTLVEHYRREKMP